MEKTAKTSNEPIGRTKRQETSNKAKTQRFQRKAKLEEIIKKTTEDKPRLKSYMVTRVPETNTQHYANQRQLEENDKTGSTSTLLGPRVCRTYR